MGFFIRKSKKLGLINLNLSKSGLGFSIGVKGCRLSFNKKGVQLNAGRGGLYYRKSLKNNSKPKQDNKNTKNISQNSAQDKPILYVYRTKEVENYQGVTGLFTFLVIIGVFCLLLKYFILSITLILLGSILLRFYKNKHADIKLIVDKQQKEILKYVEYCEIRCITSDKNEIVFEESSEQKRRRLENKYKNYNYSHTSNKENFENISEDKSIEEQDDTITRQKENQEEYLSKLKYDFIEEYNKKPDFINQKQTIYIFDDEGFEYKNDYQIEEHQGEREYFLFDGQWAYFNFNIDYMSYELVICKDKKFYGDCYIDNISKKTKKLLKFIKNNPTKHAFLEADLKNQDKILKTGVEISCNNCDYIYFSDNKRCPNCGYLTKYTLEN